MWIGNMHLNITKGDFIFASWEEGVNKQYRKKIHELRVAGYRKIGVDSDYLNFYEYYRKKGSKKIVTVTTMCS